MTELPLVFRADFFSRGEHYFLTKSAVVWVNETNEYVYLFSAPSFDAETVEKCMDFAIEDAQPRVKPHKEHNYTNFITIFVAWIGPLMGPAPAMDEKWWPMRTATPTLPDTIWRSSTVSCSLLRRRRPERRVVIKTHFYYKE